MKKLIQMSLVLMALVCAGQYAIAQQDAAASSEEKLVAPIMLKDCWGYLSVGDLGSLIDHLDKVAPTIMPGAPPIRAMGAQFGDPGLKGIQAGSGLAVVFINPQTFFAVAEIGSEQAAGYQQMASAMGMQAKQMNGSLVISQAFNPQIEAAIPAAQALLAQRNSDQKIRVAADLQKIMGFYGPQLEGMIPMLGMLMGNQPGVDPAQAQMTTKIIEAEARILLSIAKQLATTEITASLGANGVRLDHIVTPIQGTAVASVIASQCKAPIQQFIGLPGRSAFRGIINMDYKAYMEFAKVEANQLVQQMNLPQESIDRYMNTFDEVINAFAGGMSVDLPVDGDSFSYMVRAGLSDQTKAIEFIKAYPKLLEESGINDFYKAMGQEIKTEYQGVKRTVGGTEIHGLKIDLEMPALPAEQQEAFQKLMASMLSMEFSAKGNELLFNAGNPGQLDSYLAGKVSPTKLLAMEQFGSGGNSYLDLDMGAYISLMNKLTAGMMPAGVENPFAAAEQAFKGVPPLTFACFNKGNIMQYGMHVPLAAIKNIVMLGMQSAPRPADPQPRSESQPK